MLDQLLGLLGGGQQGPMQGLLTQGGLVGGGQNMFGQLGQMGIPPMALIAMLMGQQYTDAQGRANEANEARYGQGMGYFQDMIGRTGEGFQNRLNESMGYLDTSRQFEQGQIGEQMRQQRAGEAQNLRSRGLGNTSVTSSTGNVLSRVEQEARERTNARFDQQTADMRARLDAERLNSTLPLELARIQFLENRSDEGPDMGQMMSLMGMLGAFGGGGYGMGGTGQGVGQGGSGGLDQLLQMLGLGGGPGGGGLPGGGGPGGGNVNRPVQQVIGGGRPGGPNYIPGGQGQGPGYGITGNQLYDPNIRWPGGTGGVQGGGYGGGNYAPGGLTWIGQPYQIPGQAYGGMPILGGGNRPHSPRPGGGNQGGGNQGGGNQGSDPNDPWPWAPPGWAHTREAYINWLIQQANQGNGPF